MTRVLIVDDDRDCRQAARLILEAEGYDVAEAADGSEALRALDGVGVVLLDLMMPGMDGWSFFWQLSQREGPRPRVVVLTAADPSEFPDGANAVLRKPIEVDELLRVLGG